MAAKKQADEREAVYLACESATDLWADIRSDTRFRRKLAKSPDTGSRYHRRLLYLMVAAVYRSMPRLIRKRSWLGLMDAIEAYADGHITQRQLSEFQESNSLFSPTMSLAAEAIAGGTHLLLDDYKVAEGVDFLTDAMGYLGAIKAGALARDSQDGQSVWNDPSFQKAKQAHEKLLCGLIRDIFGNPFRPVKFSAKWRTEHATGIAAKMYDEKDFRAMPVLADALEEAGCDSQVVLSHCREPGTHVRGCWVVDLVLNRE